jgi:DNA-binding XRE family transcriptional regulator
MAGKQIGRDRRAKKPPAGLSFCPRTRRAAQVIPLPFDREIGQKLRRARTVRHPNGASTHYTQEDVAQVLEIHRASVAEIEAGRRKLSAAELVMLAEWLKVPVTELLP